MLVGMYASGASRAEYEETKAQEGTGGSISVGAVLVTRMTTTVEEEELERELFGQGKAATPDRIECFKGRPVNCATGNQVETQTDLSVGGRGLGLNLTRTYNSQLAAKQTAHGPFGFGWTSSYSASLKIGSGCGGCREVATVTQENGSTVRFFRYGIGSWAPYNSLVEATLVNDGSDYLYTLPNQTELLFNSAGQLIEEADRDGNALTMGYESKGNPETVTDASGRKITLSYNSEGEVESAKDPMGHTVKYTYEAGQLKSVTQPGETSLRWQFKYNSEHELTSETDGRGYTVTSEYAAKKVISQTDAMGRKRKWEYLTSGEHSEEYITDITEPNGSITSEKFDSERLPISITAAAETPLASTTTYEYNGYDEPVAVVDPNKHKTEYGYGAAGNMTSEKNADGDETKWSYDSTHDVETVTTPDGETTTISREAHGNPESISRPALGGETQTTKYKYDTHGDLESMTNPLGRTWKYEYDSYGDRAAEIDPEGNRRTWEYNADSHEIATVSPRGNVTGAEAAKYTTKTERDDQGRPLMVTDPLGHKTKYTYDGDGDVETQTDPNGNKTKYTYDSDDELTKVEEPNKATAETGYDSAGQVTSQTDGNKQVTKYVRNALEEVTEVVDPLGRKTTKEYDPAGNLTKVVDAAKRTTTYTYDAADLLKEIAYSDGKTHAVEYEYNKDGKVTQMKDGSGTTKYTYDELDRPIEIEDGHKEVVKHEYNLANELTKITYPNGKAVTHAYDKDGRLEKVTDWLERTTTFSYDPDSDLAATIFPTETKDEDKYAYNEADQLSEIKMMKSTETLASLGYTRDNDGQVKAITSKGLPGEEKPAYEYDANSRLAKGGTTAYEYDPANNPTKLGTNTYSYNSGDELEKGTGFKYTYNEVGQRTKTTPTTGPATTYGYDQAGNPTSVERPKEGEVAKIEDSYAYNGNDLRVSQTINGTTTYLTWDSAEEPPSLLSDGTNSYIYGPGNLPIEQINNTTGTVLYLHHDQAGSTRLITGSTGKTEATFTYGAYGELTGSTGTATTPLGYDAQYTNSDTGLIYLRNRVYDPKTAQFLTVDPLVSISGEPYGYAGDNPLTYGDAVGLMWTPLAGGAAGADAACGATIEIPGVDIGTCGAAGVATGAAVVGAAVGVVTAIAGEEGGDEGEAELKAKEAERENCGNPASPPGSKFEWKGKGEPGSEEGSWFDPETEEYLRPDFKPSSHGPHYDYRAPDGARYRIYPDGRIEPK